MLISSLLIVLLSTGCYLYLNKKTRVSLKYLYIDNLAVILVLILLDIVANVYLSSWLLILFSYVCLPAFVPLLAFIFTMIRFFRTPVRDAGGDPSEIVSPADGKVIYVKEISSTESSLVVKESRFENFSEYTKTDLLQTPCWLVGINMTLMDVHKNAAPIDGKIIYHLHYFGDFLSLKLPEALKFNERRVWVIENQTLGIRVGVVQIASKLVRRIDAYKKQGDEVKKGNWLGMIRMGSQVDVIFPMNVKPIVNVGDQVYASKTIVAKINGK